MVDAPFFHTQSICCILMLHTLYWMRTASYTAITKFGSWILCITARNSTRIRSWSDYLSASCKIDPIQFNYNGERKHSNSNWKCNYNFSKEKKIKLHLNAKNAQTLNLSKETFWERCCCCCCCLFWCGWRLVKRLLYSGGVVVCVCLLCLCLYNVEI